MVGFRPPSLGTAGVGGPADMWTAQLWKYKPQSPCQLHRVPQFAKQPLISCPQTSEVLSEKGSEAQSVVCSRDGAGTPRLLRLELSPLSPAAMSRCGRCSGIHCTGCGGGFLPLKSYCAMDRARGLAEN